MFIYKNTYNFYKRFVILLTVLDIKGFPPKFLYNLLVVCKTVLRSRFAEPLLFLYEYGEGCNNNIFFNFYRFLEVGV